jgi:glycerate dehydrogenase
LVFSGLEEGMKIVVLDGYTLNPGDIDWSPLDGLGELFVYDRTPPDQVVERSLGAEIVLTNKVILDDEIVGALPDLRYIGVTATGYNVVDLQAARTRGIAVTNVPAYSTPAVVEMVFALLLELARGAGHHARLVREGRWSASADFCFQDRPQIELSGRTLGVVGFGAIGRGVARVAEAFGLEVLIHTRHPEKYRKEPGSEDLRFVELDELFRSSDIVSLHCPLTQETQGMVDARRLSMMKRSAYLINTGRGPLVDEAALAEALDAGTIAGAGLDVLSVEPPPRGNPLLSARNCVITPHIAWATRASRERLLKVAAQNVEAFLSGRRQNVVS